MGTLYFELSDKQPLHPTQLVEQCLCKGAKARLTPSAAQKIQHSRAYLDQKLSTEGSVHYGINTGFGSLCDVRISDDDLEALQYNLIRSHACGIGDAVPDEVVKLMMLLKVQSLAYGYSGVALSTVQLLLDLYNADILPVVYQLGSLGASGDLAPLAHLCLPLIGEGEVRLKGVQMPAQQALQQSGLHPIRLRSKEGLALLNGTQFSLAYGVWAAYHAQRLYRAANQVAALSLEAFGCSTSPFDERLHTIRPHEGQLHAAAAIRTHLQGSNLAIGNYSVQDPYAFRCIPQVHGASYNAINHVQAIVTTEANSVTDNPNIFPDSDAILSGGNFHAQPLALPFDYLAIALAELGSISERRTYQLISGLRKLPPFLAADAGLHSGLMIPQYTAASIVSQNKQLCTPASVDSIVSSNGQEDHVSMASNAATKLYRVVQNVYRILGIELLNASQALHFRNTAHMSPTNATFLQAYRLQVPVVLQDRFLSADIHQSVHFLLNFAQLNPQE